MLQSIRKEPGVGPQAERPATKAFATEARRPVLQIAVGDSGHRHTKASREPTLIGLAPPPAEYAPVAIHLQAPTREPERPTPAPKDERRLATILVAGTLIAMFAIAFSALPEDASGRPGSAAANNSERSVAAESAPPKPQTSTPAAARAQAPSAAIASPSSAPLAAPRVLKPASTAGGAQPLTSVEVRGEAATVALESAVEPEYLEESGAKAAVESKVGELADPKLGADKRVKATSARVKPAARAAARRRAAKQPRL